jgi:hypothetical protein
MSVTESELQRFAYEMVNTTSPPLHPDDRFLKWTLFPAWREGKFASPDELKLCGSYGTWSRLREFQKRFPNEPLKKLFQVLRRVDAMCWKAAYLSDEDATPERCLAELETLFPELPEDLRRESVRRAYFGPR